MFYGKQLDWINMSRLFFLNKEICKLESYMFYMSFSLEVVLRLQLGKSDRKTTVKELEVPQL